MKAVFVVGSNITSPLGVSTEENFARLRIGNTGVKNHRRNDIHDDSIWASVFSNEQIRDLKKGIRNADEYSKFETLMIASVTDAVKSSDLDPSAKETIIICSTTKGSISTLEENGDTSDLSDQLNLFSSAKKIAAYFNNPNVPLVISTACISGLAAVIVARRMLNSGPYKNAIVVGADTISRFVYSGFLSFQALSSGQCRPFSSDRDGINLGEAAATILLSADPDKRNQLAQVQVQGGAMSNDANHISGPSRTGEELSMAIGKALHESDLSVSDIGFISAHGTATIFNDEMEAKAVNLSGLEEVPLNSLKGYFGHTLGAAGLLESVICIESLRNEIIIPTAGYSIGGIEPAVNVCTELTEKKFHHCLKIASGFGGCNAAVVYSIN